MFSHHINEFTWKSFLKDMLSDLEGHWCMKRMTIAIGIALFIIAFFASTFFHYSVETAIMSVITTIIVSGLAVTGAERFGKGFDEPAAPPPAPLAGPTIQIMPNKE